MSQDNSSKRGASNSDRRRSVAPSQSHTENITANLTGDITDNDSEHQSLDPNNYVRCETQDEFLKASKCKTIREVDIDYE